MEIIPYQNIDSFDHKEMMTSEDMDISAERSLTPIIVSTSNEIPLNAAT